MEPKKIKESKSAKAGLAFPVARFQTNLRKGHYAERIGTAGAVYLAGVLEYLTSEILELAGNAAREHNRARIVPRHIMLAIKNDAELSQLLSGAFFADNGVMPNLHPMLTSNGSKKKAARKVSQAEESVTNMSSENF